jgi:hypothetical protein
MRMEGMFIGGRWIPPAPVMSCRPEPPEEHDQGEPGDGDTGE